MKMLIQAKPLKEALTALSKVIPNKPNLPILGAVKLSGSKDGLTISATNLDETLTYNLKGEGGGSCILDLKELKEYTSNCKDSIQLEDLGVDRISAIFHAGSIPCIKQFKQFPLNDWPEPPVTYKGTKIPRKTLENIQKTIPSAADRNDARSIMKGILLEPDAVIATSGKELIKLHCMTGVKDFAVIPNTKFIRSATFAKSDAHITVEGTDNVKHCSISTDTWQYTVKCPIGNYPNYQQVLPRTVESTVELDAEAVEYLKKGIPLLQGDAEHNTVHLYADDKNVSVLPEDMKSPGLHPEGKYKGSQAVAVSLNRNLLVRALDLGFTKFCFQRDGFSPVMAKSGQDLYVFMPLRNKDADKIRDAAGVGNAESPEQSRSEKQSCSEAGKTITEVEAKAFPKEEQMSEEKKGFKVVEGTETDPFEELLESIADTRNKAKGVLDSCTELGRNVKSLRVALKQREREFKSTRELLSKLKRVSGF